MNPEKTPDADHIFLVFVFLIISKAIVNGFFQINTKINSILKKSKKAARVSCSPLTSFQNQERYCILESQLYNFSMFFYFYNKQEEMIKSHNLIFSHKNKLTINTRPKKQSEPSVPNLKVCSIFTPSLKIRNGNSYTSLDKENMKQPPCIKPTATNGSIKGSLKTRSHSGFKLPHKSLSKLQYVKQPNKKISAENPVKEIITLLKKNSILVQNHSNNYTINKDSFFNLINYFLPKGGNFNTPANIREIDYLSPPLAQISHNIADKQIVARSQKFKIESKVTGYTFSYGLQKRNTQLEKLDLKKQSLLKAINQLEELAPALTKKYLNMQKEINYARLLESANAELASLKDQKQNLCKQIEQCKRELQQAKQASQKVSNQTNNQKNQLINLASQSYKNIESDIYDYASYLQCNQLASSLTYEPLSVTCLTNQLEDQLREINRTLMQNESMDAKEKGKAMRDFLLEWINRFKKKDEEQEEIIKFKTLCVQNFIEKMKKWLDNWTLKQEYLVRLRDEFSMNTVALRKLISQFSPSQQLCKQCISTVQPLIKRISVLSEKIETNYKLGNSFY